MGHRPVQCQGHASGVDGAAVVPVIKRRFVWRPKPKPFRLNRKVDGLWSHAPSVHAGEIRACSPSSSGWFSVANVCGLQTLQNLDDLELADGVQGHAPALRMPTSKKGGA